MEARQANLVQIGGLQLRFIVDETESRGSTVAFEFIVPQDAKVPAPHYHETADEIVFGLEGTLTTRVDGKTHEVRAGESVFIPRGAVHHHENLHAGAARVLIAMSPGTRARLFRGTGRRCERAGQTRSRQGARYHAAPWARAGLIRGGLAFTHEKKAPGISPGAFRSSGQWPPVQCQLHTRTRRWPAKLPHAS